MKLHSLAAACALLACSSAALAADPTASLTGATFVEYTLNGPVGDDNLNQDETFYWFKETAGTYMGQQVQSWFLIFDPRASSSVRGTVSFDQKILFVLDDKSELMATAGFQKPGVTYIYTNNAVGLEAGDKSGTSFAGNTLTLKWTASDPGDHIRVMTAVPEPGTYALMAAGLAAIGFVARRRKQA